MPSDKSDKAELPVFGPNGAVLNSVTITEDVRQRLKNPKFEIEEDRTLRESKAIIPRLVRGAAVLASASLALHVFAKLAGMFGADTGLSPREWHSIEIYSITIAIFIGAFSAITGSYWRIHWNKKRANQS